MTLFLFIHSFSFLVFVLLSISSAGGALRAGFAVVEGFPRAQARHFDRGRLCVLREPSLALPAIEAPAAGGIW